MAALYVCMEGWKDEFRLVGGYAACNDHGTIFSISGLTDGWEQWIL